MADDKTTLTLQERLQRLEDLEEIRQLYTDYVRHLDGGNVSDFAALFSRDAKLRCAPVLSGDGREEIAQAAARIMSHTAQGAPKSVHLIASPHIENLSGDSAHGQCVWSAMKASDAGPKILVGRHIDEFVREEGRWRFASRSWQIDIGALR